MIIRKDFCSSCCPLKGSVIFILYSNPCEILLEYYWMVLYSKHYLSHLSTFLLHLLLQSKWISCLRQWSSSSANFSWIIIWFGTLKSDHGFTIMHFSIPETVDRKDPKGSTYTVRHFLRLNRTRLKYSWWYFIQWKRKEKTWRSKW